MSIKNLFNLWYKPKKDNEIIHSTHSSDHDEFIIVPEKDHEVVKKTETPPLPEPSLIKEDQKENQIKEQKEDQKIEEKKEENIRPKRCLLCLSCIVMVFLFYKKWRK